MSVLIPNDEVFNYIHAGMTRAAYRRVCDEWYSGTMSSHFKHYDIEKESKRLIESWMELNLLSYHIKYRENRDELQVAFKETYTHKEMQEHQLLKYIQCVDYNIEIETIEDLLEISEQQRKDYKLLKQWCNDVMIAIINETPKYKKATWSE